MQHPHQLLTINRSLMREEKEESLLAPIVGNPKEDEEERTKEDLTRHQIYHVARSR